MAIEDDAPAEFLSEVAEGVSAIHLALAIKGNPNGVVDGNQFQFEGRELWNICPDAPPDQTAEEGHDQNRAGDARDHMALAVDEDALPFGHNAPSKPSPQKYESMVATGRRRDHTKEPASLRPVPEGVSGRLFRQKGEIAGS